MTFEIALHVPQSKTIFVLPLKLTYVNGTFMVLDAQKGLDSIPSDWETCLDLAGVNGRILHWFESKGDRVGLYGFETILLDTDHQPNGRSVWLTTDRLENPMVQVRTQLEPTSRLQTPMCGAEFIRGRCADEVREIQKLLTEYQAQEVEDEIKANAPWLSTEGNTMKVGSLILHGEETRDDAVVFSYPDKSKMGITQHRVIIPPVTFSPGNRDLMMWHNFGRA
jgi:hypothetical protein